MMGRNLNGKDTTFLPLLLTVELCSESYLYFQVPFQWLKNNLGLANLQEETKFMSGFKIHGTWLNSLVFFGSTGINIL